MKEIVDIYVKIIIALFGFVAPSFALLISIFIEGIEKKRIKQEEEIKQLETLISKDINNPSSGLESAMKSSLKKLTRQKKKSTAELNLLNPKRQVTRMFLPLLLSLGCISIYYFEKSGMYPDIDSFYIKLITILISTLPLSYATFVLWQLFGLIIDTKKALITEKEAVVLQPSDNKERI